MARQEPGEHSPFRPPFAVGKVAGVKHLEACSEQ
jgi:hypothetical protein